MGDLFQKGGNMSKRLKVRIMKAVIAGALSVMAVVLFQAGDAAAEIKFGTLPRLSAAELQTMYAPLVEYLSKETGEQISIVVPKSFEAFKDKDSAAGYIFQLFLLSKAGLNAGKDFTVLPFAKKHDNITMAVFNKTADAGGIREDELEKMRGKVDIDQLRIVGYTDYFPNWPVFAAPGLDKGTAAKIRAALLKLKPNDPQNEKILALARLTGFVPVSDKEYDDLRKAVTVASAP